MVQNTKQELLDYIKNATEIYLRTHEISISTEEIANHFHLSRSLISKYLNSLFDERKLIKISTRPVIYFDLDTINEVFDLSISEYEFISLKEFEKMLDIKRENEFFKEIVGKNSSLKCPMGIISKILNK